MNTIEDLKIEWVWCNEEFFQMMKNRDLYYDFSDQIALFQKLLKQWTDLEPKILEELLVLQVMKKKTNPQLIRYNAKFQILVNQAKDICNQIKQKKKVLEPVSSQLDEKEKRFLDFLSQRVRMAKDGYTTLITESVKFTEIKRSYNRWGLVNNTKGVDAKTLESFCDKYLGDAQGKGVYRHIRVFMDEDDLEDFDTENKPSAAT